MKTPGEYIVYRETDHWADQEYSVEDIKCWIKQAQIDAYNKGLEDAAEYVRKEQIPYSGKYISKKSILTLKK
jgi:hypothetical protein